MFLLYTPSKNNGIFKKKANCIFEAIVCSCSVYCFCNCSFVICTVFNIRAAYEFNYIIFDLEFLMLKNIVLSSFLNNCIYLGYHIQFTNSKMFVDLYGYRALIDIHNLHTTLSSLKNILGVLQASWKLFSCLWVIAPKNQFIKAFALGNIGVRRWSLLYIWYKSWVYGILTNASDFLSLPMYVQFPSNLFYLNYTENKSKFIEGYRGGFLQTALVDSNSDRAGVDLILNANEKSRKSYFYFFSLLILLAFRTRLFIKKRFIIKDKSV